MGLLLRTLPVLFLAACRPVTPPIDVVAPITATASAEPVAVDTPCVARVAIHEIGVKESGCSNCGPKVEQYLASTNLGRGYPWCASFLHWSFAQCDIHIEPAREFAAAARFAKDHVVFRKGQLDQYETGRTGHQLQRISEDGDVGTLYYQNLGRVGHCFLIIGEDDDDVTTIEGNGLPLTAMIVTPLGMRVITSLKIGDEISDPMGSPSIVTGIYPQGVRPTYEILFTDGSRTITDEKHRWLLHVGMCRRSPQWVLTTKEMLDRLNNVRGERMYLPSIKPVVFADSERLPMDSYLMGALIGDGGLSMPSSVHFTSADQEILDRVTASLPLTCSLHYVSKSDYRINGKYMFRLIESLNLNGCRSYNKFIPDIYKYSSVTDRMELLRGLMDTDGTADKLGRMSFASSSKRLSEDVLFIIQSLGGKAGMYHKKNIRYTSPNQVIPKQARDSFIVNNIRFPEALAFVPFHLKRKRERVRDRTGKSMNGWGVKSITSCGEEETVCISVSAPSKLYMTDHFIPTHNTSVDGSREGTTVRKRVRDKETIYAISRWR